MHKLVQIMLTVPQTTVTAERVFSSAKRIKTGKTRFNCHHCPCIQLKENLTKTLDKEAILQHFKRSKRRRSL